MSLKNLLKNINKLVDNKGLTKHMKDKFWDFSFYSRLNFNLQFKIQSRTYPLSIFYFFPVSHHLRNMFFPLFHRPVMT